MNQLALSGAAIVAPNEIIRGSALLIEDGRVLDLVDDEKERTDRVCLPGGYLLPGFIDIQVNGGGGVLFNDEVSPKGIRAIAEAHRRFGTTALMPTLISDTREKVEAAIGAVDEAIESGVPGVIGLHIEGPYLNVAKRGIHDRDKIASLREDELALLTREGRGKRIVTIAPELVPPGTIRRLREAGVIVCAGHSMASYDQTRAALDEGLDGFTHLFNAMTQLVGREPGMVGAALEDRRSRFGLIVDGHHVHPAAMRIALAARGVDGVMLVTDAMPPVGSGQGSFKIGGQRIECVDGALRGPDGSLAGSNLDMATALRNACTMLEIDLIKASRMASGNPAAFLGISHERGTIAPGLAADLVYLDEELRVRRVWVNGRSS
jgi:N-acetylglucosamine-6-phosphate deacetylase